MDPATNNDAPGLRWGELPESLRGPELRWDDLPESVRVPFETLSNDVTRLHHRWKLWKQLYGSGQRRVDLMNEVADSFFYELHFIMLDNVLLNIARLLDPATSGKFSNMSLRTLERILPAAGLPELVPALKQRLDALEELADPVLAHRDKRIGHSDAAYHPHAGAEKLPDLNPNLIESVLNGIAAAMNEVGVPLDHGTTGYEDVSAEVDSETLLYALRKSADWGDFFPGFKGIERLERARYGDIWKSPNTSQ